MSKALKSGRRGPNPGRKGDHLLKGGDQSRFYTRKSKKSKIKKRTPEEKRQKTPRSCVVVKGLNLSLRKKKAKKRQKNDRTHALSPESI